MTEKPPWMTPAGIVGRPARGRTDARRDELVRRLVALILADGFAQLTVDDLARKLRCSKTTLYGVAPSKEQLVVAAARHFFQEVGTRAEAAIAQVTDPAARITSYLAAIGGELRRMSPACYSDMVGTAPTAEIYARSSAAAGRRLAELIGEGMAAGSFRAVNAEFVGAALSLLIDGVLHGELLDRTGLSEQEAFAELGSVALGMLTRHREARRPGDWA